MKKRVLGLVLTVLMILSTLTILPITVSAETSHSHSFSGGVCACGACDGTHPTGWTAWDKTDSLPTTTGKYYLTQDVTLLHDWGIGSEDGTETADIVLCLNDKVVNFDRKYVVYIRSDSSLTLYDCGTTVRYYDKDATNGLWTLAADQSTATEYTTTGGVILGGYKNDGYGSAIRVGATGAFTMNGGTICGCGSTSGSGMGGGVYITPRASFTMNGGTICGNVAGSSGKGGGVYGNTATFTMNGGTITGNTVKSGHGGGVFLENCLNCTINGGTICDNEALYGAGLNVTSSKVTMNGGKISGNKGQTGGGVTDSGTFNMNGGEISGNTSTNNGAGITVGGGTLTMIGGKVTGNTAGSGKNGAGIYVGLSGTVYMGGSAQVTGNTVGGAANNVYLATNKSIILGTKVDEYDVGNEVDMPNENFRIGIKSETAPTSDKPVMIAGNGTADDVKNIIPDDTSYKVQYNARGYMELVGKTIADVLATAECGFPTSDSGVPDKAWVNENDHAMYLLSDNTFVCVDTDDVKLAIPSFVVTACTEGYTYTNGTATITFNVKDGVLISITLVGTSGGVDGTYAPPTYAITNGTTDANGTITVSENAKEGETVTVTVNPAEGYQLKSLKYNDGTTDYDIIKDATTGDYQFTMPAKDVTVTAEFELTHVHAGTKQNGQPATETAAGFKDYYECDCGLYFEDEECTTEIGDDTALAAWKAKGGNGYLAKLPHSHNFVKQNAVEAGKDTAGCKEYYICSCGEAYEDEALTKKISDLNSWKAEGGNGYVAPIGTSDPDDGTNLWWLWVLIAVVVLGGGAAAYYFLVYKKKENKAE